MSLCECGCGQPTNIAKKTESAKGVFRGKPYRFLRGHSTHPVRPLAERFWPRVDQSGGPDACWPWTGAKDLKGYGRIGVEQPYIQVTSRVAYELTYGPLPEGQCALHRCDNPPCCNPVHLFAGTKADNNHDMKQKGRARGRMSQTRVAA